MMESTTMQMGMLIQMMGDVADQQIMMKQTVETVFDKIEYKLVAKLSCHGSIRSGYHVSNERIAKVLGSLLKCDNPWTCAHGRPTILRMEKGNLENWFKR